MFVAPRKHPRLRSNHPGEVEILLPGKPGAPKKVCIPVTIRSVSVEGVGVSLDGRPARPPGRGDTVTMRIGASGHLMELPGRVAWFNNEHKYAIHLGIHLQLEFARAPMRHAYAHWVVDLSRSQLGG
jgi:hypothetical protein